MDTKTTVTYMDPSDDTADYREASLFEEPDQQQMAGALNGISGESDRYDMVRNI